MTGSRRLAEARPVRSPPSSLRRVSSAPVIRRFTSDKSGAATGQPLFNRSANPTQLRTDPHAFRMRKRSAAGLRCNLRGEISGLLLDALAELVAHEARDRDGGTQLLGCCRDHVLDPGLAV